MSIIKLCLNFFDHKLIQQFNTFTILPLINYHFVYLKLCFNILFRLDPILTYLLMCSKWFFLHVNGPTLQLFAHFPHPWPQLWPHPEAIFTQYSRWILDEVAHWSRPYLKGLHSWICCLSIHMIEFGKGWSDTTGIPFWVKSSG